MQAPAILSGKNSLIKWASGFSYALVLCSNSYEDRYGEYELIVAVADEATELSDQAFFATEKLFGQGQWLFGFWGYDLKNQTEKLSSKNIDRTGFAEGLFFAPHKLIAVARNGQVVLKNIRESDLQKIISQPVPIQKNTDKISWRSAISKEKYIHSVQKIKEHIRRGDIYEANFCQEFYAQKKLDDPAGAFIRLTKKTAVPFAAFLRAKDCYAMSLSPERFLCKRGKMLISQPIKGTAPRARDGVRDQQLKTQLSLDLKERAENIMITDLVRNDMARSALPDTVRVEELCRVYSFPSVHQMISTVTGQVQAGISPVNMLRNMFPMGSMTGAPKVRAMELMEQYEHSKRGLYSGALGYFSPQGDFDFSVVIRTLLYNAATGYLSYHTGSAITYVSDPHKEYAECLLKRKVVEEI